ncbi:MAG: hypothetical protein ISS55_09360 [Dehalococcoidales bacterium]|nr:hypothetical protein [Dehalococcoidales bacterium]
MRPTGKAISVLLSVVIAVTMTFASATPVSALSAPTVTLDSGEGSISFANADYTIRFNPGLQLKGPAAVSTAAGAWVLPDTGDTMTFTDSGVGTDVVILAITGGAVSVAFSPAGAATYAAGVITFNTAAQVATVTCTTETAYGTWAQIVGGPTVTAIGVGGTGDTITIAFPYNTGITAGAVGGTPTLVASPGWIDNVWLGGTALTYDDVTFVGTAYNVLTGAAAKIVCTLGNSAGSYADLDMLGEGADVRIQFVGATGITNPATIGDYTLTVKTTAETTAVTSAPYSISAPSAASVTTNPATAIETDSATLNGALHNLGGYPAVDVSFAYGVTQGGPYGNETAAQILDAVGSFAANITGLQSNATYYFRVKGTTNGVTAYGAEESFTTLAPPPTEGCFIATASYGTDTAIELDTLREFRDEVLKRNSLGAEFVSLYYRLSPPIAEFISQHSVLRAVVREGFVDPIVRLLKWSRSLWHRNSLPAETVPPAK